MEVTHSAFTIAKATEQVEVGSDVQATASDDSQEWDQWDSSERESETATSEVEESMDSFSNTVENLLQESLNSFLDEGPVLHPLEHHYSELKGGSPRTFSSNPQSTRDFVTDCLSLVCECKDFEYAIIWEMDNKTGLLTAKTGYYIPGSGKIKNFYMSSLTLRAFPLGLELPGRVAFSGQVEWCDQVHEQMICRFHRVNEAKMYGVQTVVGIPVACGVLEFGSSKKIKQCPQILRYIHNVCKPLVYCLQESW